MDSRWFKLDRKLPKNEQAEAVKAAKETLRNSRFITERLEKILDDEIDATARLDEDFDDPNWERKHVALISRRKTLRDIKKLLDFKEAKTNG